MRAITVEFTIAEASKILLDHAAKSMTFDGIEADEDGKLGVRLEAGLNEAREFMGIRMHITSPKERS